MDNFVCKNCGANALFFRSGFWICPYCDSKFVPDTGTNCVTEDQVRGDSLGKSKCNVESSNIGLDDDISRLLMKCKREPRNARRYANLILDIDPDNQEARKYL